jgi:hypothetical protein
MHRLLRLRCRWGWALYVVLDALCAGLGMGVPIFNIVFGLPVGWAIARRLEAREQDVLRLLRRAMRYAALTSGFTLLVMAILWGRTVPLLFVPGADLANFGHPMFLFEPRASFIGWLVLMILVSPFLQFLMSVLGAVVTLLRLRKDEAAS